MTQGWKADPSALFERRLCTPPKEGPDSVGQDECPDLWRLDNGDIAVIGTDLTDTYASRLPDDVLLAPHERLVVIPGKVLSSAKKEIPDA